MNIPKKIKIGGMTWDVEYSQPIADEGRCYASTHFNQQKFYIEPSTTRQNQESSLVHEILHAIIWQSGLRERYSDVKEWNEEEIVKSLEGYLYQVLKENKL